MTPSVSLRKALEDPLLLGNVLAGDSWFAWRVLLIAAMGEPLLGDEKTPPNRLSLSSADDDGNNVPISERAIFQQLTQRDHEPGHMVEEFIGVIARRGGKTRAISAIGAYIGGLCKRRQRQHRSVSRRAR
jgi:hypothetical protein